MKPSPPARSPLPVSALLAANDAPAVQPRSAPPASRVVVIGGGYAGVLSANRIAGKLGARGHVTLVEAREDLVHRVRLHEVVARGPGKTHPLDDLLRRSVARVLWPSRVDSRAA